MSDKSDKMHGKIVSEEEAAIGLGFASVDEFRRWQTEIGRANAELKHELYAAKNEAERFRYNGRKMQIVLEKVEELLNSTAIAVHDERVEKLLLAINVVNGRGVDWNNELEDWFKPLREKSSDS